MQIGTLLGGNAIGTPAPENVDHMATHWFGFANGEIKLLVFVKSKSILQAMHCENMYVKGRRILNAYFG
uniref:Uncharacterized protein n=1 Tax=Romanomermis culicivorax TaxID=13658 RepID=A0A915IXX5_ROMCU